ncbi:MAG: hypothetical protein ISR69_13140 [Gammaproteobacteria bacterium]|nr:hypothetical protein [Gammaproteobacteria bacterium]
MKRRISKIAALISVAFTQSNAEAVSVKDVNLSDYNFQIYKADLNSMTPIYLAGHSSHASHGSHGSHRSSAKSSGHNSHSSHRSSTPKSTPTYTKPASTYTKPASTYTKPSSKTSSKGSANNRPVIDRWKSDPLGQTAKPKTSFPPPAKAVVEKCSDGWLGKRKEVVKKVQMYLFLSGHYANDSEKLFSGIIDNETRSAVKKFKKENRLTEKKNTLLDSKTLNTMGIVCD